MYRLESTDVIEVSDGPLSVDLRALVEDTATQCGGIDGPFL